MCGGQPYRAYSAAVAGCHADPSAPAASPGTWTSGASGGALQGGQRELHEWHGQTHR